MSTPKRAPERDPRLFTIERRMADLAHELAAAKREAEALAGGIKGFLAGFRGERDTRLAAARATVARCQSELTRMSELHENRIAEIDPAKAEELRSIDERRVLIERAARIRKRGGTKAAMLERIEGERRKRLDYIEALEHALYVGDRARDAIEQYVKRLRSEQIEAEGSLTGQMGKLASVGTVGAEARDSLLNFYDRIAVADESMVQIAQSMHVDRQQEVRRCENSARDVLSLMIKTEHDLDAAREELRPIESAYRSMIIAASHEDNWVTVPPRRA